MLNISCSSNRKADFIVNLWKNKLQMAEKIEISISE
jgi:hypothetical protein